MNHQYYFKDKSSHEGKNKQLGHQTSIPSFNSAQYSQQKIEQNKIKKGLSFFNQQSSIKLYNSNESGQFIYFNDDNSSNQILSSLNIIQVPKNKSDSVTQNNKKQEKSYHSHQASLAFKDKQKPKVNLSKDISFQDSLIDSHNKLKIDDSKISQYGTGKNNLPQTVRKPKFGFKISSDTAESQQIIKGIQIANDYQIKVNQAYHEQQTDQLKNKNNNSIVSDRKHTSKVHPHSQSSSSLLIATKQKYFNHHPQNRQQNYEYYYGHPISKQQDSISSIRKPEKDPSVISKSDNPSQRSMQNFKSVFKDKIEKASSINSSLSKSKVHKNHSNPYSNGLKVHKKFNQNSQQHIKFKLPHENSLSISQQGGENSPYLKDIKLASLQNLHDLQIQLGKLKHQNKKIIEHMIQQDMEIQKTLKKKQQLQQEDPYAIIKENQLIKVFLNNKNVKQVKKNQENQDRQNLSQPKANIMQSARSLKYLNSPQKSIKSSIRQYDFKAHKLSFQSTALNKSQKKCIFSNRGLLFEDKHLEVGYSLKNNLLTIYLTIKTECEEIGIKFEPNSLIIKDKIDRIIKNKTEIGKQLKFKTDILSTTCNQVQDQYEPPLIKLSIKTMHKANPLIQHSLKVPLTVYNLCKFIQPIVLPLIEQSQSSISQSRSHNRSNEYFKTVPFLSCSSLINSPEQFLTKVFPLGVYDKQKKVMHLGFEWKQDQINMRVKLKERQFLIEGEGNPYKKGGFEMVRSVCEILMKQKEQ